LLDLGYAVTAHRAQGVTTDTAHVLVEPTTTKENFYVAMTRGRHSNHAYVVLDRADATARSVLHGVLQHVGAELSANETITTEHEQWGSVAQFSAEYETIAAAVQHDRWATLIRDSGLTEDQASAAIDSDAFGALTAELRRAEANHHDLNRLFPRLVAARGFGDADDIASVLHHRLARATARPTGSGRAREAPRLIAGLVPVADGPMADDMRQALDERRDLIEKRANAVLDSALNKGATWTKALGPSPHQQAKRRFWLRHARIVAAYRDRYGITDDTPLGPTPVATAQKIDAARAKVALDGTRSVTAGPEEAPRRQREREPLGRSF
jgi:hypothetical protein